MATGNEKARKAACNWAVDIANDNSFHYGESKWAHHSGCYFCGTNGKGSAKYKDGGSLSEIEKSYCCNPFVTAAYHHGAGAPSIDCKVKDKRINLANDTNKALQDTKEWKKIDKPSKVTSLQYGDILLTPTHAMLYIGDGKIVHAAGHDDGKKNSASWNKSIRVEACPSAKWKAVTKIYRYIGKGKFKDDPKPTTPTFKVGQVYTLQANVRVRNGAGTKYDNLKVKDLTADGKKHCTSTNKNAAAIYKKGTRVTVKAVKKTSENEVWIKTPSGWLCAYLKGSKYIK